MKMTAGQVWSSGDAVVHFEPEQRFDSETMRHFVNDVPIALHCHHYSTLLTQLATDAEHLGGPGHLVEAAAESFFRVLREYMESHHVPPATDRIAIAEEYFAFSGLGTISFSCFPGAATVTMEHSHIDEGWIDRWGVRDKRVNFIGEGYIKAAIAVIFDFDNWYHIEVEETRSIVRGAPESIFDVKWDEREQVYGDR